MTVTGGGAGPPGQSQQSQAQPQQQLAQPQQQLAQVQQGPSVASFAPTGHRRNISAPGLGFGHRRCESSGVPCGYHGPGHKRPDYGHRRTESISGIFGHKRSESASNHHMNLGGVHGHRRNESMYAMTGLYSEASRPVSSGGGGDQLAPGGKLSHDTVIRCHSRNPSSGLVDHRDFIIKCHSRNPSATLVVERPEKERAQTPPINPDSKDCGILSCRPVFIQRFAGIR
ncbi:hypothetical protein QAD02_002066, partial [Eretmocerus hayati]